MSSKSRRKRPAAAGIAPARMPAPGSFPHIVHLALGYPGPARLILNLDHFRSARFDPEHDWQSGEEDGEQITRRQPRLELRLGLHVGDFGENGILEPLREVFHGKPAEDLAAHLLMSGQDVDGAADYFRTRFGVARVAVPLDKPEEPAAAAAPELAKCEECARCTDGDLTTADLTSSDGAELAAAMSEEDPNGD